MVAPIPTPALPEGDGTFSVVANNTINASAATIYNAIVDTSTWPEWNTFVPGVEITSQPSAASSSSPIITNGTEMKFTVHMSSYFHTTSPEKGDPVPPPPQPGAQPGTKYVIGWVSMGPSWQVRAQRINEIVTTADPSVCEYNTYETFGGPMATVVKMMLGSTLAARFEDWARDLKAYCEKKELEGVTK